MTAKKGFDLASVLGNVSNLDTGLNDRREQIKYIDIDLIDDDPNNFYTLSGIEELAANIELLGLQQPLRVRPNPHADCRVIIVSGHRRRAALRLLVDEGKEQYRQVPCIEDAPESSAAMQELRLIYANSDTRKLTSAELGKQAQRVEALLYQLKEEGVEFPGRMRDHVAEACKVSKSKLARLKVIRENLQPFYMTLYENGKLHESVAYEIARMPWAHQSFISAHQDVLKVGIQDWAASTATVYGKRLAEIDKVECKGGGVCTNRKNKYLASLKRQTWESDTICARCCSKCDKLVSCKYACPGLAGKVKRLKADAKARQEQEQLAQQERDAPIVQNIKDIWSHFAQARTDANKSIKECCEALGRSYGKGVEEKMAACEAMDYKFSAYTELPFGYAIRLIDAEGLVKLADLLDCSVDYLLCRTDVPKLDTAKPPAEGWLPLQWIDGMEKPHKAGQKAVAVFQIPGLKKPWKRIGEWNGTAWVVDNHPLDEKCVRWFPLPEDECH